MDIVDILKRKLLSFDYLLFIMVMGLCIFGIVAVGSATHIRQGGSTAEYDAQKLWVIAGAVLMLLAAFIDYNFICKFYILSYVVNIGLLLAVLLFGTTMSTMNVTRSIDIAGFGVQPSEFAKVLMLVFMARLVERLGPKGNNFFVLLSVLAAVALPVYLIMRQPSLSAAVVVLMISLVTMFLGGLSYKYVISTLAVGVPGIYFIAQDMLREKPLFIDKFFSFFESYGILEYYQVYNRIIPFLKPEMADGAVVYQTMQSIRAIGSGQLTGKGLYEGTLNSLYYLPASHNDFIFAVIGEEFGYVGCICILAVLFVIIIKCIFIAYKSHNLSGKLIASGVAFMLTFQTFVNVGVTMGILPNTGMVLPFISYGGSSMLVNMIAIGLVINVGMSKPEKTGLSLFEE
ncbi:MAG: FtsW/RodA/SpoVE family cell cycle protein [Clostridiales bacterium]|jgi:rod shape determining protein RodA|nr:FtsW/RodA/SpoVE family cell cycle protein [Clostridiales bacterium]